MKKTLIVVKFDKELRKEQRESLYNIYSNLKEEGYILLFLEKGMTLEAIQDPED